MSKTFSDKQATQIRTNARDAFNAEVKAGELWSGILADMKKKGVEFTDATAELRNLFVQAGEWPTALEYHRWAEKNKDNYSGDEPKGDKANAPVGQNKAQEMDSLSAAIVNRFNAFRSKFSDYDTPKSKKKAEPKQPATKEEKGKLLQDENDTKSSDVHQISRNELLAEAFKIMEAEAEANKKPDQLGMIAELREAFLGKEEKTAA